jgi:hypothetical protein
MLLGHLAATTPKAHPFALLHITADEWREREGERERWIRKETYKNTPFLSLYLSLSLSLSLSERIHTK